MRSIVIGLGIQGRKRLKVGGTDIVGCVDPVHPDASFKTLDQVPFESFDSALVCTPDTAKMPILQMLLSHGKHVLVEKPLIATNSNLLHELKQLAQKNKAALYTAYNHRFEPHIAEIKKIIDSGKLGQLHFMKIFYGNGTARDVRNSVWRDSGSGVLRDLGSHLLDLSRFFFNEGNSSFSQFMFNQFENRAFDHVLFGSTSATLRPNIILEASLLSWKNSFTLDLYGEKGSAHVVGLCKWGPSQLIVRERILPSGRPKEEVKVMEEADPTWSAEYEHFKRLCTNSGTTAGTNVDNDIWIQQTFESLVKEI